MNKSEIREIVKLTIEELSSKGMLKKMSYQDVLKILNKRLYKFFDDKTSDKALGYALRQIADDNYIDIIYLQYRDNLTMESIAEYMDKEVSTIKRNKKRLIMRLYEYLEADNG